MKFLMTSCLALCTFAQVNAQFTQSNEPTLNASQTMYACANTTESKATAVGTGVIWDYSTITNPTNSTKLVSIKSPTQTTQATQFTSSSKAFNVENSLTNYFTSSTNERISQGFVIHDPTMGDIVARFTTDPQKLMNYPFNLNSSVSDLFSGKLSFTYNGIPQNPDCNGVSKAEVDAQGTLKLGPTTFNSVLRYHIVDTLHTTITILFTPMNIDIVREQFEYYDLTNNSLPLFTHTTIKMQQVGNPNPLASQVTVLSSVQPSLADAEELNQVAVAVFPNPAVEKLVISGLMGDVELRILSASGEVVKTTRSTDHKVDVSDLTAGAYFISWTQSNEKIVKTFVKQ